MQPLTRLFVLALIFTLSLSVMPSSRSIPQPEIHMLHVDYLQEKQQQRAVRDGTANLTDNARHERTRRSGAIVRQISNTIRDGISLKTLIFFIPE